MQWVFERPFSVGTCLEWRRDWYVHSFLSFWYTAVTGLTQCVGAGWDY